jgi:hypothetical protein
MGRPSSDFAELHAWAIDEAAALVTRSATARSDVILREFDAVRKAFEMAARSIESALAAAPTQASEEVDGFVERLTAHVGLDAIRTELQQRTAALQERDTANQRLKELLKAAQVELEGVRGELKSVRGELTAARGELTAARGEVTAVRGEVTAVRGEAESARSEAEVERARAESVRADAVQMATEFESTLDELRREHAAVIGEQAATYTSLPLDELLTVFNALAKATTVSEVLTALVNGIAREFSRVALFDVHGSGLKGTRQVGFDFQSDISKVVIPLSADSLLTRAVKSGRVEGFFAAPHSEPGSIIPFGGTPACALAIPIVVQRTTVAMIYADDSDRVEFAGGAPQLRAKFAELLQQHALLVLVRIWVDQASRTQVEQKWRAEAAPKQQQAAKAEQRTRAELREFAIRLADQLETDYTADAEVGRNRLHCQQRLKVGLERSRRLYAQQIGQKDPSAAALLDEHLAAVARARSETSFGRDLAALLAS